LLLLNSVFLTMSFTGIAICFIALVVLLFCSALVSGSEVAFFSLSPSDLDNLSNEEDKKSKSILKLRNKPRKLLATILISNNFINIAIVVLSDFLIGNLLGEELLNRWGSGLAGWSDFLPGWLPWFSVAAGGQFINILLTIVAVTFLLVLFGEVAPKVYANLNNLKFARFMVQPMGVLSTLFSPVSAMLVRWSSNMESRFIYKRSGIDDTSKDQGYSVNCG